jgi:hypothetical protein
LKLDKAKLATVGSEICRALIAARMCHAPMASPHEGYAVILEELDELWDEVRLWKPHTPLRPEMRQEALHVAAMALAFVIEVCDKP